MQTGDIVKIGTLSINGVKQRRDALPVPYSDPKPNDDYGYDEIQILDTDADDDYALEFVAIVEDGKRLLIAKKPFVGRGSRGINYKRINSNRLSGQKTIDGKLFKLRLLTGGSRYRIPDPKDPMKGDVDGGGASPIDNEWDRWLANDAQHPNLPTGLAARDFWGWSGVSSWCEEVFAPDRNRDLYVSRGWSGSRGEYWTRAYYTPYDVAWRPVLELVNADPAITVNVENNKTLYENNTISVNGFVGDADIGDTVTVKYQIDNGAVRALSTAVSNGLDLPFNKSLTFRNKRLFDGVTAVSDELNGGIHHTLKVWAEDDKGGKSAVQTRTFQVVPNRVPTLTLNTESNKTLYERDKFLIYGSAKDADSGDTVTVKFQINSGTVRNLHSSFSDGSTNIPFSKQLTYSDGVLKDGSTHLTGVLDKGTPHTLSVWSEDGNGGKSAVQTRTFNVVPNRPPTISVNPIAPKSDLINSEVIEISGNVSDLDDNNVTMTFAINDGATQQLYSGKPSAWSFNVAVKDLEVGANRITIKARDVYQAESVKVVTITKKHDAVPVNQAVALYKINPPAGNAQKILLWIERQLGDLAVTAEVSMTNDGETENFAPLPLTNSELKGVLQEDEFAYQVASAKTNIILKVVYSRTDPRAEAAIKRISGVLA